MRITNNMMINNMMLHLNRNMQRMDKTQQQMSTGKKILVPSDDPIVAARALKFRTNVSEIEQFKRNVEDGLNWMEITETSMKNMGDILQRVRELTVQASNDTLTKEDRMKIQEEIKQNKDSIIFQMNTTYAGRYIYSGFSTDKKFLKGDGSYNNPDVNVDAIEKMEYEISVNNKMDINTQGKELMEFIDKEGTSNNLMTVLDNLINDLGQDGANISSYLTKIDGAIGKNLEVRANLGARYNRLEATLNRLGDDLLNFTKLMSENEDADMAEVLINLKNQENVYQASMASGARIIQPTLIDFLR